MSMALPGSPSAPWLLSFWLAVTTVLTLFLAGLVAWYGSPYSWMLVVVLVAGAAAAAAGAARPWSLGGFYAAWNRMAGHLSRVLRMVVVHVCYFVVIAPLRLTGSRLPSDGEAVGWTRADFPPLDSRPSRSMGWMHRYLVWTRETSNLWAISLLPFLLLLRSLENDRYQSLSDRLYTLF